MEMNMNPIHRIAALVALGLSMGAAQAQEAASAAEAQERLKAIVALVKAKGAAKAAEDIMASDPFKCKFKDLGCMLATTDAKIVANPGQPAMVGQQFPPDFADIDGTPLVAQLLSPAKAGKLKWEAKYKFNPPGSKKIVPRHSFCEKAGDTHVACVTISQQ
jgi:signal transduction histidine kinase